MYNQVDLDSIVGVSRLTSCPERAKKKISYIKKKEKVQLLGFEPRLKHNRATNTYTAVQTPYLNHALFGGNCLVVSLG